MPCAAALKTSSRHLAENDSSGSATGERVYARLRSSTVALDQFVVSGHICSLRIGCLRDVIEPAPLAPQGAGDPDGGVVTPASSSWCGPQKRAPSAVAGRR